MVNTARSRPAVNNPKMNSSPLGLTLTPIFLQVRPVETSKRLIRRFKAGFRSDRDMMPLRYVFGTRATPSRVRPRILSYPQAPCQEIFVCYFCFTSSVYGLRTSSPQHLVAESNMSRSKCRTYASTKMFEMPGNPLGVQNCLRTFRTKSPRGIRSNCEQVTETRRLGVNLVTVGRFGRSVATMLPQVIHSIAMNRCDPYHDHNI